MYVSTEAFEALVTANEQQGGATLPDVCMPQSVTFEKKHYHREHTERRVTCGCGQPTRLIVIYDHGLPADKAPTGAGYLTVCAVCDNVGHMPRFIEPFCDADPELDPRLDEEENEDA